LFLNLVTGKQTHAWMLHIEHHLCLLMGSVLNTMNVLTSPFILHFSHDDFTVNVKICWAGSDRNCHKLGDPPLAVSLSHSRTMDKQDISSCQTDDHLRS
jgi:hypothetical protein